MESGERRYDICDLMPWLLFLGMTLGPKALMFGKLDKWCECECSTGGANFQVTTPANSLGPSKELLICPFQVTNGPGIKARQAFHDTRHSI